jgi:hypothetical protein
VEDLPPKQKRDYKPRSEASQKRAKHQQQLRKFMEKLDQLLQAHQQAADDAGMPA